MELHNTIYSENLMLFYQSTKVAYLESEVSSDSHFLSLHLLLEIPLLQMSCAYLLFKVEIPLVSNGTCLTVQSTKYLFSKTTEYEFMDLNEETCIDVSIVNYSKLPASRQDSFITIRAFW